MPGLLSVGMPLHTATLIVSRQGKREHLQLLRDAAEVGTPLKLRRPALLHQRGCIWRHVGRHRWPVPLVGDHVEHLQPGAQT